MAAKKDDIYQDIEYVQVTNKGKTLLHIEGHIINGQNETFLRERIGEELGEGYFQVVIKHKNKVPRNRKMRAFVKNKSAAPAPAFNYEDLNQKIELIASKIDKSAGMPALMDFDKLINFQTRIYQQQMEFMTLQMQQMENKAKELMKNNSGGESDISTILTLLQLVKGVNMSTPQTLADNVSSAAPDILADMPSTLKETLSGVDYAQISPDAMNQINEMIKTFIKQLPQKER